MTLLVRKGYKIAEMPICNGVSVDGTLSIGVFKQHIAIVFERKSGKLIGVYSENGNEELALIPQ